MKIYAVLPLLVMSSFSYFSNASTSKVYLRDKELKTPEQINVSIAESSSMMNVTFTTINTDMKSGYVTINKINDKEKRTFNSSFSSKGVTNSSFKDDDGNKIKNKAYYYTTLEGLEPNTHYQYQCFTTDSFGTYSSDIHDFWTPINETSDEEYSFIYIADPQANIGDGKATSTTTEMAKTLFPDAKFIYIAGDLINGSWPNYDEEQWETLFNVPGSLYYNKNFNNQLSNYTIAAIQGNHDEETLNGHINHPSKVFKEDGIETIQKITYSFSWGNMRFVMLNTEWRSGDDYRLQKKFVKEENDKAKALGQRIAVCFHRSMYTGASHISSEDSIERRIQFADYFASLGIDFVLQGHDHVIARGQVDGTGHKVSQNNTITERMYYDTYPENAVQYFVGGTASTFKAYGASSYTISDNDPLTPNYSFLDLNSASKKGSSLNPYGPSSYEGVVSPSFTNVTVGKDYTRFDTYCYSYSASSDEITSMPILFDSYTITNKENVEQDYKNITTSSDDSGCVVKAQKKGKINDQVFFSLDMSEVKEVDTISIKCGDDDVPYTENRFGYQFKMPNNDVTITLKSKKSSKLPFEDNSYTVLNFSNNVYLKDVAEISKDMLGSNVDGYSEKTLPINNYSFTSSKMVLLKYNFSVPFSYNVNDIKGFSGTHNVKGGFIIYLNGECIYKFNVGEFGQVRIDRDIALNNYQIDAVDREYLGVKDIDNYPTSYSSLSGIPLFEAYNVSSLSKVLRNNGNTLSILFIPDSDVDINHFNITFKLNYYSSSYKSAINEYKNKINGLYDSSLDVYYENESIALIHQYIEEGIAILDERKLSSLYEFESLYLRIKNDIANIETKYQKVERLIDSISSEQDIDLITEARREYESLDSANKAMVANIEKLISFEQAISRNNKAIEISKLPNKLTYYVGESLDLAGLEVSLVKYDGSKETTSDYEVSNFSSDKPGQKIIVVSYNNLKTYFKVSVVAR